MVVLKTERLTKEYRTGFWLARARVLHDLDLEVVRARKPGLQTVEYVSMVGSSARFGPDWLDEVQIYQRSWKDAGIQVPLELTHGHAEPVGDLGQVVAGFDGVNLFTGFGHAQEKGAGIDQLYNAAKKEGRVVLWGPTDAIIYQKAQEALHKKYPGIRIEHFESIPEPAARRVSALTPVRPLAGQLRELAWSPESSRAVRRSVSA